MISDEEVQSLYLSGIGYKGVARELGCSVSTVRHHVKGYVITTRANTKGSIEHVRERNRWKRLRRRLRDPQFETRNKTRYLQTSKGVEYLKRRIARTGRDCDWHDISQHMIFVENVPCSKCGETDKTVLQCDHIIPRALWILLKGSKEGMHDRSNLDIKCIKCHAAKTREDIQRIICVRDHVGHATG
jgi:transposase